MKRFLLFSLLLLFAAFYSFALPSKIDSLRSRLRPDKKDTAQINLINNLSREFLNAGAYDSGHYYANRALALANSVSPSKNQNGIAAAYYNIGSFYHLTGDYLKALEYHFKALDLLEQEEQTGGPQTTRLKEQKLFCLMSIGASYFRQGDNSNSLQYYFKYLKIAEELGDKNKIATAFSSLGFAYRNQDNFPKALEYDFKALKLKEEIGDKKGVSAYLGNIGMVYDVQGDIPKALEYRFRALKIAEDLGDKSVIAENYGNLGIIYSKHAGEADVSEKDSLYEKARDYFSKALDITKSLGNKTTTSLWLNSMGTTYYKQSKSEKSPAKKELLLKKSLEYHFRSLALKKELGNKFNVATQLISIGSIYTETKNYSEAEKYLLDALKTEKEIGALQQQMKCELSLSDLYEKTGRAPLALDYYKKAMDLQDTLFNVENSQKNANTQFQYEQEKKDKVRELEQKAKEQEHQSEVEKQKIIIWSAIAGLLLVIVFAGFVFRSLRLSNKQKAIIEEKNKEITDSINYAQRIQKALLASDDLLNKNLGEHFVLFKPKDIVSGDFYWAAEKDGRFYLAVCDSTGHGVPGAFMSLLNISFLNEAINERVLVHPNRVFNHVRQRLIENISSEGAKDGMDGILVCIDKKKNKITYSAAYNAPLLIDGSVQELDSDNMPIGLGERKDSFSHYTISSQPGNMLYLYTDGFADQFGGPKGKKFKYKKLNELLFSVSTLPAAEQKQNLEAVFENWKGNLEQIDDVLVVGIRTT